MICPTPNKRVYFERKDAKRAARRGKRYGMNLHAYKCACGAFHLSSGKRHQPASERVGAKLRGVT